MCKEEIVLSPSFWSLIVQKGLQLFWSSIHLRKSKMLSQLLSNYLLVFVWLSLHCIKTSPPHKHHVR